MRSVLVFRLRVLLTAGLWVVALMIGKDNCRASEPLKSTPRDKVNNAAGADWRQFRGPGGQGRSAAQGLPLTWSETENVTWKAAIPGLGWSSPVIQGEQVWLTTALADGRSLRALCLDRTTGKLLHDIEVFARKEPVPVHAKNSHATPTPVLDGKHVYVHFGPYGTACLTTDGRLIWKTALAYLPLYGPTSSPVLFGDLMIIHCDGIDVRYVVCLDKHTGKVRWKQPRDSRKMHELPGDSTPLVIRKTGGYQLISNVSQRVVSYDLKTGKELWWVRQDHSVHVPRPVYGHGLVFVCGGFAEPDIQAIRPTGRGDVTQTHVVWSVRKAVPQTPSPLLDGDELYLVSDKGVASCLDARTGKLHWRHRVQGSFSASPVCADARIYLVNEDADTTVVAAGREFRKLATNRLEGRTSASPAIAGKAIYLRTNRHLYRIDRTN